MKQKKRKHDPNWKDSTKATRQSKRTAALNEAAGKAGYFYKGKPSWSAYETAVINGKAQPTPREPDKGNVTIEKGIGE